MTHDVARDIVHDLAPTGVLRAAINLGNSVLAQRDAATRELCGVSVDLARELGRRLGVAIELVTFAAAGKVFEALKAGAWDVAFLAVDPARGEEILFTAPYVLIEGTFMVRSESALAAIDDVDRPGVRIAVGAGAAYDLFLTRTLAHAKLVRSPTADAAFEQFMRDGLEAAAGVRQVLVRFAGLRGGLRVMDGAFMTIEQAMGTPRPRVAGSRYLSAFVEDLKRSGFVAAALQCSGQSDASVAPPISD
jgi:polar amino acid transport system substrate-binding protein